MQKDTILRFDALCNKGEQKSCGEPMTRIPLMENKNDVDETAVAKDQVVCDAFVPFECPRIRCKHNGEYTVCRRTHLAEQQMNESGVWVRLPCGTCEETKDLHPTTKSFVVDM